jgi:hypothetical protein
MTEYELLDALNGLISNTYAAQAFFVTIVSAYVVTAYTAGAKLSVFQVGFISLVFVVLSVSITLPFTDMQLELFAYAAKLDEVRGYSVGGENKPGSLVWTIAAIRILMVVGALVFMWSVRRNKG